MWDKLKVYGPFALLVIAGFAVAAYFIRPAPPSSIRMATGAEGGAYAAFGERYKVALAAQGVEVELVQTAGALSNLELLSREQDYVDVAFLQGGIGSDEDYPDLVSLASLYPEPLWLLVRADVKRPQQQGIRGFRIAIGAKGSGSSVLADDLLRKQGYGEDDVVRVYIGGEEAAEALVKGDVDAAVYVTGGRSKRVLALMETPGIELVPFGRAETFARLYRYISVETLPEGAIDLARNIPADTIEMLATSANLVAREDLHPAIQSLLLQAASEIHEDGGLFSAPGEFPNTRYIDFPLSAEAERYFERGPSFLQRYLPFWAANLVQRMIVLAIPLVTLLIPFFKFAPPLYQWRVRRRIYIWYKNVRDIEAAARADMSDAGRSKCVKELDRLQAEVGTVKVPLSYSEQLFHLRLHIHFLRDLITSGELSRGEK